MAIEVHHSEPHHRDDDVALGKATVISLLGGPGAGKGTQCERQSRIFDIEHISVGNLLRDEMNREKSEYGAIIKRNMLAGVVGPKEITVGLLRTHMSALSRQGKRVFVLDGFPRSLDQAEYFERTIAPIQLVIVLRCSEETIFHRLLPRGRFDDNRENILKRINTFNNTTSDVIAHYQLQDKVENINSENDIESVSSDMEKIMANMADRLPSPGTESGLN